VKNFMLSYVRTHAPMLLELTEDSTTVEYFILVDANTSAYSNVM
jgi:hypothetical protein